MSMTKQDFIALADVVRLNKDEKGFTDDAVLLLAGFCEGQNPRFNRQRWLDYIAGKCGPSGGRVK